jgi:hypothetical protein
MRGENGTPVTPDWSACCHNCGRRNDECTCPLSTPEALYLIDVRVKPIAVRDIDTMGCE